MPHFSNEDIRPLIRKPNEYKEAQLKFKPCFKSVANEFGIGFAQRADYSND